MMELSPERATATDSGQPTATEKRWKSVQLGLRLANNYFGGAAFIVIYVLWLVIALVLGVALLPFTLKGKVDFEKDVLNPFALYGFVWPIGLTMAAIWTAKLVSRLLWCRIPGPPSAGVFAIASVVGRLSVVAGFLNWFWHFSGPRGKQLLTSETIACSVIAWLCLVGDWGFLRILRGRFLPAVPSVYSPPEMARVEAAPEQKNEAPGKNILTEDVGNWFKARFPKVHKVTSWIILPLAYIAVSSLADNGNIQAIPAAILRLIIIAPAMLQAFWTPVADLNKLISAVAEKTALPEFRYT
jgi:hypothetical protein